MIKIPIDPALFFQSLEMSLDGLSYQIETRYQQRDDSYYLSVSTSAGDAVFTGCRVVVDRALGAEYRGFNELAGRIVAYDASGKRLDPKRGDLGARVQIYYLTNAEIAEIAGLA